MDRMKRTDLFSSYIQEKNPEHWRGFSEVMWDLGFEMDCYRSKPECESFSQEGHSEKEIQDHILTEMLKWNTQEVGNYIFSRYRELTHWSDYGYPEEKGHYFFERAFPILAEKIATDRDSQNMIPNV